MIMNLRVNKYKNRTVLYDGIKFDSVKEKNRYQELKLLERAGKIEDLVLQQEYELIPKFRKNNKTYRKTSYKADFSYFDIEGNKYIVEDVKGFKTDVYKLKKKLFEYRYKDLEIKEI